MKIDNSPKIGNVVWFGEYIPPPEQEECDIVSSWSEESSSESESVINFVMS